MFYVNSSRCKGCGLCAGVCPKGAIRIENGKSVIEQRLCVECGACLRICPTGAIYEVKAPVVASEPKPSTAPYFTAGEKQPRLTAAITNFVPRVGGFFSAPVRWFSSMRSPINAVRQSPTNMMPRGRGFGRRRRWRGGRGGAGRFR
jgi:Fe-S-cluster-containing hydrogenase component 2